MSTWMLVEDEPDMYEMVLAMYEILGVHGVSFTNGEEALDWIEEVDKGFASDEVPELALLDIRLPGQASGPDVGARLRKSPVLKNAAIVLMTAYRLTPQEEKAIIRKAHADLFLYKPLPNQPQLATMLNDVIARRHSKQRK
ncbi:MAG: response regulator [Chloroflexi bacterium]|nr:response regulator [Chloroflexota bacterium]